MPVEHRARLNLPVGPEVLARLADEAKLTPGATVVSVAVGWLAERAALTPFYIELPCDGCGATCRYVGRGDRELYVRAYAEGTLVPRCEDCTSTEHAA